MKITVTGNSQMTLPAECVSVGISAGFTGPDRAAVVADTAALVERLRARLDEATADGRGRDVRLSSLRTWTSVGGKRGTVRHVAEVRGSFVLDDLGVVGPLLGELAGIDGVQIGNLDWQLTENTLKAIHLENMLRLSRAGAVILPPSPGFYQHPQSVQDIVDFVVARVLDQIGVPHALMQRWGEEG